MGASSWPVFLAKLTPLGVALIRDLFVYFSGDLNKARDALVFVRNHGIAYAAKQAEVDARLGALEEVPPPPPKETA